MVIVIGAIACWPPGSGSAPWPVRGKRARAPSAGHRSTACWSRPSSPSCSSPSWRRTSACSGSPSRPPRSSTAFLVGHRRTQGSLEASWKYIVICSVGIALAFLGTVLVYLAALHAGGHSAHALDWTSLIAHARRFDPSVMRLAFGLLVLGYGTKVGLAPMHSWLPDAHSQAPAPCRPSCQGSS